MQGRRNISLATQEVNHKLQNLGAGHYCLSRPSNPKGPSTQDSNTVQNPNLHNYYPKTEYLIIGSFGPLGKEPGGLDVMTPFNVYRSDEPSFRALGGLRNTLRFRVSGEAKIFD